MPLSDVCRSFTQSSDALWESWEYIEAKRSLSQCNKSLASCSPKSARKALALLQLGKSSPGLSRISAVTQYTVGDGKIFDTCRSSMSTDDGRSMASTLWTDSCSTHFPMEDGSDAGYVESEFDFDDSELFSPKRIDEDLVAHDGFGEPGEALSLKSLEKTATFCEESNAQCEAQALKTDKVRMKFFEKLSYSGAWAPESSRPPSHLNLIVFDWDDTLLCSTFLRFRQAGPLPSNTLRSLQQIEKRVMTLLMLASTSGQAFIITNAEAGWVERSAAQYLPGVLAMLERVSVISARSRYQAEYPDDVYSWKTWAFLELQQQLDPGVMKNIVSVGGSCFDAKVARKMGRIVENAIVKTIKFQDFPTPEELVKEQAHLCKEFKTIVGSAKPLTMRMRRTNRSSDNGSSECS
mmetsp:Transcript_97112/g.168439  ORF Transcript_97112/g.168439 Transcript_97112/m.168439 type:complete len:407 (-) Transcript_97112:74-1294(-)